VTTVHHRVYYRLAQRLDAVDAFTWHAAAMMGVPPFVMRTENAYLFQESTAYTFLK